MIIQEIKINVSFRNYFGPLSIQQGFSYRKHHLGREALRERAVILTKNYHRLPTKRVSALTVSLH